jgi:phosphate transport system protein
VAALEDLVLKLFGEVREAVARSTFALLNGDRELAQEVVDGDQAIDDLTSDLELEVWQQIDGSEADPTRLRSLIGILLILPELERSADLAEHIAQRSFANVGAEMSPVGRGIVQRMSEVAAEMWQMVATSYVNGDAATLELAEEDEELDILHERLTTEVNRGEMSATIAAQVTLVARFYERIGDHAVNLSRRIASFQA